MRHACKNLISDIVETNNNGISSNSEMSVKPALGYIIIDFISSQFKYRINSLNIYYDTQHQQLRYICGKPDDVINEQNSVLKNRFQTFLSNGKTKELLDEKPDDKNHAEAELQCDGHVEDESECP